MTKKGRGLEAGGWRNAYVGDRCSSLKQGMTAFRDIGNNRAIAGGFAPIASQLEANGKESKG